MDKKMEISVRRLNAVLLPGTGNEITEKSSAMTGAMAKNVESLGFMFSCETAAALSKQDASFLMVFWKDLIEIIKSLIGADVEYKPFYPNFPEQVMNASDTELWLNAVIHYASFGTFIPDYKKEERFPLIESQELKVIRLTNEDEFNSIVTSILSSSVPLSETDKEDLEWFMDNTDWKSYVPAEIPMKETKALVAKKAFMAGDYEGAKKATKTATDLLRLLAAVSECSPALLGDVKFRKLKRPERRFVMDVLSECGNSLSEDMARNIPLWITVGEIVHPGEFSNNCKYKTVFEAFHDIRSGKKIATFASEIERVIKNGDWKTAACMLSKRPGEFARRLDQILRMEGANQTYIMNEFEKVAPDVSTRVLWQAKSHFDSRNNDFRAAFPKGIDAKCHIIESEIPYMKKEIVNLASKTCYNGIISQYKEKEPMGKVYIDPDFMNYAAPFAQRSASNGFRQVGKGSRLPIDDNTNIVRPFIWWTNMKGDGSVPDEHDYINRIDMDLSVTVLDDDWKNLTIIDWTHIRNKRFDICHSGDITNGGPFGGIGASEFVDIDIDSVLENGGRYVAIQVHSFTIQPFCDLPCAFGWMERNFAQSGKIYEPSTVQNRIGITSHETTVIPAVIDCLSRQIIWCDLSAGSSIGIRGNTAQSNLKGVTAAAKAIVNWTGPSLYEIAMANAEARGLVVSTREEADLIFSDDRTIPIISVSETDENGNVKITEKEKEVSFIGSNDLAKFMEMI